ncbi:CapA family protein [Pontibacillus salicampi]
MKEKLWLVMIVIVFVLAGCTNTPQSDAESKKMTLHSPSSMEKSQIHYATISTATLSAIGDVLIHDTVYNDAKTDQGYNFTPIFQGVKSHLEQADITVANSESIIGGTEIGVSSYPTFNSPTEVGDAMKKVGVDVVSMANNHTLDQGIIGIQNAIEHWDRLGVAYAGAALSEDEAKNICTVTKHDITFSFLSFTYGTNGIPTPTGQDFLVNRIDRDKITSDISRAKKISDVVVLSLHFGNEYERMPSAEQRELAHFAAEQGADIILGHHPHVLQPPEWVQTSDNRQAFVAYSLGNFLSGQENLYRRIGGIMNIKVEKQTTALGSSISIAKPSFVPTYVTSERAGNYAIKPLKEINDTYYQHIKQHMRTWIPDLSFAY